MKPKADFYIKKITKEYDIFKAAERLSEIYGGAIFAELSVKKYPGGDLLWRLEYVGSFPSQTIESYVFKELGRHFGRQIKRLAKSKIPKIDRMDALYRLKYIFQSACERYVSDEFRGNVVIAGRIVDQRLLRNEGDQSISGKCRQKPAFARNTLKERTGIIPIMLAPRPVLAELCRHKSARYHLFQSLLAELIKCQQTLLSTLPKSYFDFQFRGQCTFLVTHALALWGTGKFKSNDGSEIGVRKFVQHYLTRFGIGKTETQKAINHVLSSPDEHRILNQLIKPYKNALLNL